MHLKSHVIISLKQQLYWINVHMLSHEREA